MLSLFGSRSRALFVCVALTFSVLFMLALASHANAAYLVPNFTVTAAPTQAAGHPKITVAIDPDAAKADSTGGDDLKDLTIDAPAGLQLNQAAATTKCTDSTFTGSGNCPSASQVGTATVKWRRSSISSVTFTGKVYVLTTPAATNTAALGLVLKATGFKTQAIRATVSNALPVNAPTRVSLTGITRNIQSSIGLNLSATIDKIDVVLNAKANSNQNGPYFTLSPSSCTAATTQATFTSYANVVVNKSSSYAPTGCSTVKFTPTATVAPTVTNIAAPTGLNASFTVPAGELTTQQSAVKNITIATPSGVLLNQPAIAAVIPCSEANLAADTCPAASKIGTTSFTFWGAAAAPGDVYLTAQTAPGFNIAAVSRGANGVRAITRGTVAQIDSNGDGIADSLRLNLDSLPTATWSAASLNISSLLLLNNCPTDPYTTTIQGASASTVVLTGTWLLGICDTPPETTITSGPSGYTNLTAPQFAFTGTPPGSTTLECQLDGALFAPCASPYTTPALSEGPHTFCVRAVSGAVVDPTPACRTFTVDTVAPVVTITTPMPPSLPNPTFAWTVTDASPIVSTRCTLDGSIAIACTSPWSLGNLSAGPHTITICATDAASNTGCATLTWTPNPGFNVSITSGPSGVTNLTSATYTFTSTDSGVTFQCSFDGSAYSPCASPKTYIGFSSGAHTFCLRGVDSVGNFSLNNPCQTFFNDIPPPQYPTVVRTIPLSSPSSQTVASFTITPSEAGHVIQYSLDGSAYVTSATGQLNFTGLANGAHTLAARQVDALGNTGPSATNTWVVDTVPPPAPVVTGPTGIVPQNTASITFSNTEPGVTFSASLDGAAFTPAVSPANLTNLANGTHTFAVRATDAAGNVSSTTTIAWTVMMDEPGLAFTGGPVGYTGSTSASFTWVFQIPSGTTYECQLDGGPWTACTTPRVLTGLSQGSHTFCVRATNAGSTSLPVCRTWTVDTIAPQITFTSPSPGPNPPTSLTFSWTITDASPIVSVTCQLDGGPATACSSPRTITGLASGSHTFTVCATDAAGNTGCASLSWTGPGPPPTVTITGGPSGTVPSTSAAFPFVGSAPGLTYQCSLDGSAYAACTSPASYTGLTEGQHQFCVRATDSGGSQGSSSCRSWIVDTVPPAAPTVTLVSPTVFPTMQTTATISVAGTEPGGSLQGSLDGAAFATITSPVSLTGLGFGAHTYSVRQMDAAGNVGSVGTTAWVVGGDPVAPTLVRTSPVGSPASQTTASFVVSNVPAGSMLLGKLDGASFASVSSPITLTGLTQGSHTYQVQMMDQLGNLSPSASSTWVVDTVPPSALTATLGPLGGSTASVSYSGVEPGATVQGSLDGAAYATAPASPVNFTGLSNGAHVYSLRQVDPAGNISSVTSVAWSMPGPIGQVTITSGPSGLVTSTAATFTFAGTVADWTFQCQLDGVAWTACVSPISFANLAQGNHTFCVRAVGPVGDLSSATCRTWTVTVDGVAPSINGLSSSQGADGATITYSAADNSGATPTCTPASGTTFPFYSTANLIVTVTCLDASGNMNTTSLNITSNGPAMGLVTTFSGGPNGNTSDPAPTFTYSVNRATSGTLPCSAGQTCAAVTVPLIEFSCTTDGNDVACGEGSFTSPALTLGVHTFCVRARGIYSGEASAPACRTFTVASNSSALPVVTVTSPPFYGSTGASPMNVAYQVDGSTTIPSGTTCSVNGVASTDPTTNAAALSFGTNAIPVTCTNASGSDTEYVVMTRMTGFGVAVTTPAPNSTTSSASVNVTYNRWNVGSSVACTINGVTSTSGSVNDVSLPLGTSSIDLVCTSGGNVSKSSSIVTRGNPPAVAITAPADNSSAESSADVSYTVDGSTSMPAGTTCRVNGVSSTSATTNTVALASGANLITVSCSNTYGYATATVTVNNTGVATSAPVVAITAPTEGAATTAGAVTVNYTVTPADASCDHVSGTNKVLSAGANTITVTCTNSAGSGSASVHVTQVGFLSVSGSCTTTSATDATCTWSRSGGAAPYVTTCSLDGATPGPCTGSSSTTVSFAQPIATSHTMRVCISDASNQQACTSLAIAPPGNTGNVVNITSGPGAGSIVTNPTATFTYAATQQTSGTPCPVGQTCVQVIVDITPYYCSFDGGAFQFCGVTSPTFARFTTPTLVNGAHTFCVKASGVAGIDPQTHNAIPNGVYGPSTCRSFTKIT